MNTVLIITITVIISAAAVASLIINIRDLKWRADIQTYEGRRKLSRLGYERLEMIRLRLKTYRRGWHADSDYTVVPLDAPMKASRPQPAETWKSVTGLTSFDSPFGFQSEEKFDELRVYGYKNGERHLAYTYAYYPENYSDIKNKVDAYNKKGLE